jgi:hypothetical protein
MKKPFKQLLGEQTFAPSSKVSKLMKSGKATDVELATAATTTKSYKENSEFKAAVDDVISGKTAAATKVPEKAPVASSRGGEKRGY